LPKQHAILEDVRTKLLPCLDNTIQTWRDGYDEDSKEAPEDYFDELVSAVKEFREELSDHPDAALQVGSALSQSEEIIEELRSGQVEEGDSDDFRGHGSGTGSDAGSRSVFDDVDL
jgi:hypothetical protein